MKMLLSKKETVPYNVPITLCTAIGFYYNSDIIITIRALYWHLLTSALAKLLLVLAEKKILWQSSTRILSSVMTYAGTQTRVQYWISALFCTQLTQLPISICDRSLAQNEICNLPVQKWQGDFFKMVITAQNIYHKYY